MAIARKKATEESSFKERMAKAKKMVSRHREGIHRLYGEYRTAVPTKAKPTSKPQTKPPTQPRMKTLDDLKQVKELKDKIKALEARITRKDAMIKSLKRRIEKLKDIIESPKKEEQRQLQILAENPDFLEI